VKPLYLGAGSEKRGTEISQNGLARGLWALGIPLKATLVTVLAGLPNCQAGDFGNRDFSFANGKGPRKPGSILSFRRFENPPELRNLFLPERNEFAAPFCWGLLNFSVPGAKGQSRRFPTGFPVGGTAFSFFPTFLREYGIRETNFGLTWGLPIHCPNWGLRFFLPQPDWGKASVLFFPHFGTLFPWGKVFFNPGPKFGVGKIWPR